MESYVYMFLEASKDTVVQVPISYRVNVLKWAESISDKCDIKIVHLY